MLTVVVRSLNDAGLIERTLRGIRPGTSHPVEVLGIDSGSTDGTLELQAAWVDRLYRLPPARYLPGAVLNFGVAEARGEVVVFLNSDCVPTAPRWLDHLVAPILAGEAEATFGRQDARGEAWEVVRKDHERAFGDGREAAGWRGFFSVAVAAFRRDVLLGRPFPLFVRYSEDLAWFEANRAEVRVRYVPAARVEHSHNYPSAALWRRFRGEGAADARIFPLDAIPNARLPRALLSAGAEVARDWAWCVPRGAWRDLLRAAPYRLIQRLAYWWGLRAGRGEATGAGGPVVGRCDWRTLLEIEQLDPGSLARGRA